MLKAVIFDIDGTLIRHQDRPDYSRLPELLPGSREKLCAWVVSGYRIVLCTARSTADRARLAAMLTALEIPYHDLICGLPGGMRVLINDRKPQAMFAAQALSVNRELGWDTSKVNVNGGAIAIGHPIGASGARVLVTLLHEMQKRDAKKGLATLCIGGGMGIAMCIARD